MLVRILLISVIFSHSDYNELSVKFTAPSNSSSSASSNLLGPSHISSLPGQQQQQPPPSDAQGAAGGPAASPRDATSPAANKQDSSKTQAFKKGAGKTPGKTDMSAWFNLFADLDPLANPDAIGQEEGAGQENEQRNC